MGISALANYWQDPGAVSNVVAWILRIVDTASDSLHGRLHRPRLEVLLEPVQTYPDPGSTVHEQSTRKFKSQSLRLKTRRNPIHQCKARILIDGGADYLLWNPKLADEAKDLAPEEETLLPVWQAVQEGEQDLFHLNVRNKAQVDIRGLNATIAVAISFLSEDGLLNNKPYRFKISCNSWDTVNMAPTE